MLTMIENADRNRFASMLRGKTVVLGITASISIYRVPDLIRDLRREGANVKVGMSREAVELVSPKIMEWASGNPVVTEMTGKIEHIAHFSGPADQTVLAVVPCTHNMMGKMAGGISDDVPSAFYSFATGNENSVVVAPAMHEGMYKNPSNGINASFLEKNGVDIIPPQISEEKAKLSASDEIVDHICRAFYQNRLAGKKVMIISGHTDEPLDPVRSVSNHGTGFTGYWLARVAYRLGASSVTYIGNSTVPLPSYVKHIYSVMSQDMERAVINELENGYDVVLSPASISDFTVDGRSKGKMDSAVSSTLKLVPRGKIVDIIRKKFNGVLVPFSLTSLKDGGEIMSKFRNSAPDIIVANGYSDGTPFGRVLNDFAIITGKRVRRTVGISKPELAVAIFEEVEAVLSRAERS